MNNAPQDVPNKMTNVPTRKQLNFNSLLSMIVGALVALVAYGGKHEFEKIDNTLTDQGRTIVANNLVLTRVETTQGGVLGRLLNVESAMKELVTRSEMNASLSIRDQEISDLKKELESLRRKYSSLAPPYQPPPFQSPKDRQ